MPTAPQRKPNRYELPLSNMVGAMLVVILFVVGFVIFRALNRDNSGVQSAPVNYLSTVAEGRADGRIGVWAPAKLPAGWRATRASYVGAPNPHWALSATDGNHYLGIAEGIDGVAAQLASAALQGTPTAAGKVQAGAYTWTVYTDSQGEYALVRTMPSKIPRYPETLVVVGTTAPSEVRSFAASLQD